MGFYLHINNELVPYELGDILDPPVRSVFLVSDSEISDELTFEFATEYNAEDVIHNKSIQF